jgi:serpin B
MVKQEREMLYRKSIETVFIATLMTAVPALSQEAVVAPEESIRTISVAVGPDAKTAIAGINAFSLDLYRRTLSFPENHFLSPASVSVAVGLAYRGARGVTALELEKTLHFGKPPRDYLRANGQVLDTMSFAGPLRELRTANAVWLQNGLPLLPDFEKELTTFAKAGLQRVDFRGDAKAARFRINGWVAERTRDKIKDLLQPDDATNKTRAILVNAIYWKGAWASEFDKRQTKPEPFTMLTGDRAIVPLMHQRSYFQVMERDGIKAILLPYVGYEVEMAVFLPNATKGLPAFEKNLTTGRLSKWLNGLATADQRKTDLTMPHMHVEWRQDLKNSLAVMGAPTAFSDGADFSGIATFPYAGEDPRAIGLKIAKVIHKAYLDVDEFGSEAAAATAVVMDVVVTARGGPPPPPPFIFRADKPFLFLLRDRRTGLILFIGRYVKADANAMFGE